MRTQQQIAYEKRAKQQTLKTLARRKPKPENNLVITPSRQKQAGVIFTSWD